MSSYEKYRTQAVIIKEKNFGEADKLFTLYTEEFGLVFVIAKGVRLLKSKLKPSLKIFRMLVVTLIKGKDVWRLTDAECLSLRLEKIKEQNLAKTCLLLAELVQGQEKNTELFKVVESFFLENPASLSEEDFELWSVVNVLHALGYGSDDEDFELLIRPFSETSSTKNKKKIISLINNALASSQLRKQT